ncbi:MAG TPA: dihydrodipicolinate synthase family protein [Stellaceae bacterium]|nr:dihydrodipicolinate synthase family protein [Stellaceae bacterium]
MPEGLWVASLTPLDADFGCDTRRLADHCRFLLAAGCDGIALFGTTGEGPSFTARERRRALEAVIGAGIAPDRIILGTGCPAIPDTIELSRAAAEAGCAGSLVLPPFFFKGVDGEGVFRAFARIAEGVRHSAAKLYLYNIPSVSAVALDYETIERLACTFPGVIAGVKDSSLDWSYTAPLLERFPDLAIFVGAEHHIPQALRAGAAGTICGLANVAPRRIRALYDAVDAEAVRAPLAEVETMLAAIEPHFFVTALRAIAAAQSGDAAWRRVRPPLYPLDAAAEQQLLASLAPLHLDAMPASPHVEAIDATR